MTTSDPRSFWSQFYSAWQLFQVKEKQGKEKRREEKKRKEKEKRKKDR